MCFYFWQIIDKTLFLIVKSECQGCLKFDSGVIYITRFLCLDSNPMVNFQHFSTPFYAFLCLFTPFYAFLCLLPPFYVFYTFLCLFTPFNAFLRLFMVQNVVYFVKIRRFWKCRFNFDKKVRKILMRS